MLSKPGPTLAATANKQAMLVRVRRAMENELDLANVAIRDSFPMLMHIGDIVRILIRDHLRDYGYSPGEIELGPEAPCAMPLVNECAHDVLMTLALVGHMDWRVDEHRLIHFWRSAPTTERDPRP